MKYLILIIICFLILNQQNCLQQKCKSGSKCGNRCIDDTLICCKDNKTFCKDDQNCSKQNGKYICKNKNR